ncbi:MAG: type II toxin-antitoxin system VapC family toxin [Ignisphaera sp.]
MKRFESGGRGVVDASVVVKWFVEEEHSRESRLLRDAYAAGLVDLSAPAILPFEVVNALKYSGAFSEEELKEVAKILADLQISLHSFEEVADRAVEIAVRKGLTIYDASYVALALQLGAPLYTADGKLLAKIANLNVGKHVSEFRL